jgi:hypothetical protein
MGLSIKWNKLVHKYSNCSKYYGYVTHEGWKTTISWSALVVNHSEVDKAPSWVQLQATFRKWTDVNNVASTWFGSQTPNFRHRLDLTLWRGMKDNGDGPNNTEYTSEYAEHVQLLPQHYMCKKSAAVHKNSKVMMKSVRIL